MDFSWKFRATTFQSPTNQKYFVFTMACSMALALDKRSPRQNETRKNNERCWTLIQNQSGKLREIERINLDYLTLNVFCDAWMSVCLWYCGCCMHVDGFYCLRR